MHLVDRYRGRAILRRSPGRHPGAVAPIMLHESKHTRCRRWRRFLRKRDWVGLQRKQLTISTDDLELIEGFALHAGNEELPDAGFVPLAHRMPPAVPAIEVAHDANAARVGCPDGKRNALRFLQDSWVGP